MRARLLSGASTPILGKAAAAASKIGDIQYAAVLPGPEWVPCNGTVLTYKEGLPVNPVVTDEHNGTPKIGRMYASSPTVTIRYSFNYNTSVATWERSTDGRATWTAFTPAVTGTVTDLGGAANGCAGFAYAGGYFLLLGSGQAYSSVNGTNWVGYNSSSTSGYFFRGQILNHTCFSSILNKWVVAAATLSDKSYPSFVTINPDGSGCSALLDCPDRSTYSSWAGIVLFDDGTGFYALAGGNTYYTANTFASVAIKNDYPWGTKKILYCHLYKDGKSATVTTTSIDKAYFTRDRGLTWTTVTISGIYDYGLVQGLYWGGGYNLFGATDNLYSFVLSSNPDLSSPVLTVPVSQYNASGSVQSVGQDISDLFLRCHPYGRASGNGGFELEFTKTKTPALANVLGGLSGPILKPYLKAA